MVDQQDWPATSIQQMSAFQIRPITDADRNQIAAFMADHWGAEIVVVHGTVYRPAGLPGFVAFDNSGWLGLVTYWITGKQCEIVTLDSLRPSQGIGTALIQRVRAAAVTAHCHRLWLITTNDNLNALRFYQKRGFVLVAVHPGAVDKARQLKPEIPPLGADGIPLRDEIELELVLVVNGEK